MTIATRRRLTRFRNNAGAWVGPAMAALFVLIIWKVW